MIELLPVDDAEPAFVHSPLLKGALLTLEYIETNGPIGLTPSKALKRYFVEWAAEAFAWPHHTAEELYYLNKVLNEADFVPLFMLHDLLNSLKLVRRKKGAVHITKLGKQLRSHPGALWAVLAQRICTGFYVTPYARYEVPFVGNWDVYLNVINVEAHLGCTDDRLCEVLFGSIKGQHGLAHANLRSAFYIHCLRSLVWLGLMHETTTGEALSRERIFSKTPLWFAALRLETDPLVPDRHVH
jgi:hypothetical protein